MDLPLPVSGVPSPRYSFWGVDSLVPTRSSNLAQLVLGLEVSFKNFIPLDFGNFSMGLLLPQIRGFGQRFSYSVSSTISTVRDGNQATAGSVSRQVGVRQRHWPA